MRCYICDVELSEGEINFDKQLKSEPCTTCQQIIYETAYQDGFEPDDTKFVELVENDLTTDDV